MNYELICNGFEDYSVVDETGLIISEHISFAGHGEVLIKQLEWGMIKPEDVRVAKPDYKRPRNYIIFGANGFLGSAFSQRITAIDNNSVVTPVFRKDFECGKMTEVDLKTILNKHMVFCRQNELIPVVINCIGIADTRLCETNPKLAMEVNGLFPKMLSECCKDFNIKLVHISTGCLYHGTNELKKETDFLEAHCNYVVTKWTGEIFLNKNDLIIRPRLLFDSREHKWNLITKLHRFDSYLNEYNSITSLDTIIEATVVLVKEKQSGPFNVCNSGKYTIEQIANSMGLNGKRIQEADLHKSQGLFLVNNVMNIEKLEKFYKPRDILVEIDRCNEIIKNNKSKI